MFPAIEFHRDATLAAIEIENVGTNWMLAAKAKAFQAASPEPLPEFVLLRGCVTA